MPSEEEITEVTFINSAIVCIGHGSVPTGKTNWKLAQLLAKQVAIGFAEFIDAENCVKAENGKWGCSFSLETYTTEQLFELFFLNLK